jgi:hypothetical protein
MGLSEYIDTPVKVGMTVRPQPLYREQDEMIVEWVGQNGNQVIIAGWCPKQLTVDGKQTPRPCYSVYSCYGYGRSFYVVYPVTRQISDEEYATEIRDAAI